MIEANAEGKRARRLLGAKYAQFAGAPAASLAGPVMAVDIRERAGWAYS